MPSSTEPPRVQGFVLRGPQPHAHQPLGDPPRLTALLAARALDLSAQYRRRLRDWLPARAARAVLGFVAALKPGMADPAEGRQSISRHTPTTSECST